MKTTLNKNLLLTAIACGAGMTLAAGSVSAAPVFINTGQTVGGTTTNITLTAGNITTNPNGNTSLSNDINGDLVVSFSDPNPTAVPGDSDFNMLWSGSGDGLNFNTATYNYVQIDIVSVTAGMTDSIWEMFWQDDDSTIGAGANSRVNLGTPDADQATPFSLIIDLVNGNATGATGWGPGTLDLFRLDPFQSGANFDQSFTISAITFGSELVPEPSSLALMGIGGLLIARRRRD